MSSGSLPQKPAPPPRVKERRITAQLVRQLSEESIKSPMAPEHVVIEVKNEQTGEVVKKKVYVTEVSGVKTLDLYSGWDPEIQAHKTPLKALPRSVCSLPTLVRLWVSHNQLCSLPAQFDELVSLKELFLHRNNFETVPLSLCCLPKLEVLWLSGNKINEIPEDITKLKALKRLHLDGNLLSSFPPTLCQLETLEVLYLSDNVINSICETIGRLKQLRRLFLQNNKIAVLPNSLCSLSNIEVLNLDNNEIRQVPREFSTYQARKEMANHTVTLKNNPFVIPGAKLKLSLGGMAPPNYKTRRHSEQVERLQATEARRPIRISLPDNHQSNSPGQIRKSHSANVVTDQAR